MHDPYPIALAPRPIVGKTRPPGSKSITNRAAVCSALAVGTSRLKGVLDSEDTQVMRQALDACGVAVAVTANGTEWTVEGCGGTFSRESIEIDVANSGTSMRFLVAALSGSPGTYRLDGVPRMRERPIGDLLEALHQLGASAQAVNKDDCPPVLVNHSRLVGGPTTMRGNVSSQFLSGLLMAAPMAEQSVIVELDGPLVSQPYVRMTLEVMRAFGVSVRVNDELSKFEITPQAYVARTYEVEPDASAASYFWAAAAITGGCVTVQGLGRRTSLQGDVAFCDCLEAMGCVVSETSGGITVTGRRLRGIDTDMNAISDTVQTLAAVALFADGPTTIRNVAHIRHKETDRIGDLARELRRLGAEVDERNDGLAIVPRKLTGARIETYRDHRMAMALSLVGLRVPDVAIKDPACVAKTYPRFFEDLARLRDAAESP